MWDDLAEIQNLLLFAFQDTEQSKPNFDNFYLERLVNFDCHSNNCLNKIVSGTGAFT